MLEEAAHAVASGHPSCRSSVLAAGLSAARCRAASSSNASRYLLGAVRPEVLDELRADV